MPKITTILIDDEPLARKRLRRLLDLFEKFDIIAEAANGKEALLLIEQHKPEVIFLDIEMPVMSGFEMLGHLTYQPIIIFTTAYDQYAIKAFEENSVDYLLKPIEKERLEKTLSKLDNVRSASLPQLNEFLKQLKPKKEIETLTVKLGDKILLIKLEEIYHIEAEDKYVLIKTLNENSYLTDFTLSTLETRLPDSFVRIHRGSIINTKHIKEIRKSFNGIFVFVMKSKENKRIISSRGYASLLRQRFEF